MKKRLFLAAVCMLVLPVFFSPSLGENQQAPFSMVAFAGHVTGSGEYCSLCGCGSCRCDPGEQPSGNCTNSATPGGIEKAKMQADSTPDLSAAAMIFALALFVWFKLR